MTRYARQLTGELQAEFDSFYALYPRKEAPRAAQQSFASARKRASFDKIMDGLKLNMQVWAAKGTTKHYIPHPTTWLNQDRFLNEYTPEELQPRQPEEKKRRASKGDQQHLVDQLAGFSATLDKLVAAE